MSATVIDVDEADFARVVIEGSKDRPVVVDFWAEWCGPCRQLSPALEQAAQAYAGEVDVVKVDVDRNQQLAQTFRVQGIPAVKAFADGRMVDEFTGLQPPQVIDEFFARLAPSPADRLVVQAAAAPTAEAAAELYTRALTEEVDHPGASLGLAALRVDDGDVEGALDVLARARPTAEVARLQASLSLGGEAGDVEALRAAVDGGDDDARIRLGRALAASGATEEAIEVLLEAVRRPDTKEPGREAILEVFTALGDDHDLVRAARPRLASALF